ncbi:MAG: NAD(P)/FAD-dependent oxidoreductase [Rhodobacterales bacterium]|nr:NAD(P)/FAD-dependent oxidoreductase [Rhodobacterales bacterium]
MKRRVLVIGAGFTGLVAALDLARAGHPVTVLEADAHVGGLAGAFDTDGERLDRFYHHWFTSDQAIMQLVDELGLSADIALRATATGVYYNSSLYRLSSPLDLLRFAALPFRDRIRLGLMIPRARAVKDWRALEGVTAADWLRQLGGERVWQVMWEPLLQGKFGPYAETVSAVWFWNKLKLRGGSRGKAGEERLAYFKGSFARLAEETAAAIRAAGGEVRTDTAITALERRGDHWVALGPWGEVSAEAVIATPAPALVADMLEPAGGASPEALAMLRRIPYLANLCLVLELDRALGSTYWTNVNDPGFPYVGVIEHTNFESAASYGGRHIVYLSKYLPETDDLYRMTDDEVMAFSLPHLQRMFPAFQRDWVQRFHVWRARWAQPVVERHYSRLIPPVEGLMPGLYLASMAQIYPEDRGTNHAVREGRRVAALVKHRLSDG